MAIAQPPNHPTNPNQQKLKAMITITISPSNTLDRQCKELTGDGYNSIEWEGDLNANPIVIKRLKTGLIVKVL